MTSTDRPDIDTAIEPPRHTSPEEAYAAARTVARYATDVNDCKQLLAMLGLTEVGPPPCKRCGQPISRRHGICGHPRPAGDGMCSRCFDAANAQRRKQLTEEG